MKTTKAGSTLADFTYTVDPVGKPTRVVRAGSIAETTTYTYDARDRLTEACFQSSCPGASDPFIRWTYDGVGNRLTEARPAGTTSYTYNAADELTSAGSTTFTYDQNGNETSAGSRTFTYDLANRLASTSSGSSTTTYSYDGNDRRIQASDGTQPSEKTNYLWDQASPLPQIALEKDGSGGLLRRYVYGISRISTTTGGTNHYFAYDGLGSVANVTSASGSPEWTYTYEPFGAARSAVQNDPSASANLARFTGELVDPSGLYYLRARQYDPATGRFTRRDPAATPQSSISSYVYTDDSPTVDVDPTGLTPTPADDGQRSASKVVTRANPRCAVGAASTGLRRFNTLDVDARLLPLTWHMYFGATVVPPACRIQAGWWGIESVFNSETTEFSQEYGDYKIPWEAAVGSTTMSVFRSGVITPPHYWSRTLGSGWDIMRIYAVRKLTKLRVSLQVFRVSGDSAAPLPFVKFKYGLPKTIGFGINMTIPIVYPESQP